MDLRAQDESTLEAAFPSRQNLPKTQQICLSSQFQNGFLNGLWKATLAMNKPDNEICLFPKCSEVGNLLKSTTSKGYCL